tara:strand:- start:941 stop:1210 length:270 start_codon:yes stop_codon:yes gene_type:complete
MKIRLELFGASRDLSDKEFLELEIKGNSSIRDLRKKIINYVDKNFKGNENFKKVIEKSVFCSEDNNIISDAYQITKDQKIGIIPPIGGG